MPKAKNRKQGAKKVYGVGDSILAQIKNRKYKCLPKRRPENIAIHYMSGFRDRDVIGGFMVKAIRTGQDSMRVELVSHTGKTVYQVSKNLPLHDQLYVNLFGSVAEGINNRRLK